MEKSEQKLHSEIIKIILFYAKINKRTKKLDKAGIIDVIDQE